MPVSCGWLRVPQDKVNNALTQPLGWRDCCVASVGCLLFEKITASAFRIALPSISGKPILLKGVITGAKSLSTFSSSIHEVVPLPTSLVSAWV